MNPSTKISINWSSNLAYAIGLITTDGNLGKNKKNITFVSKDLQLIKTFQNCLGIDKKIGLKKSGFTPLKKYYLVQFGAIDFYNFLLSVGLTPAKSKTLGALKIPNKYFFDFLRGYFDGDGSCYSYWDKRWDSSFMFYIKFYSASKNNILWLRSKIKDLLNIKGDLYKDKKTFVYQLKFAKRESKILISKMYYKKGSPCLERKYKKLKNILKTDKIELDRKNNK